MYQYERWLAIAEQDLKVASLLSKHKSYRNAADYCQQTAEKAVKAFLSHAGAPIEKTHDVERLIKLAANHLPEFSQWLDEAELITPYATRFRYPMEDVPIEPERAEFEEALNASQRLFDFVLSVLPTETHPV